MSTFDARTRTYRIWYGMIRRCTDPSDSSYKNYGGRGITVCSDWLSYVQFFEDMGEAPVDLTLERKDNNKGYCKENCVWASRKEQAANKRQYKNNTTGYPGIYFNKAQQKYFAHHKGRYFGRFDSLEQAVAAQRNRG